MQHRPRPHGSPVMDVRQADSHRDAGSTYTDTIRSRVEQIANAPLNRARAALAAAESVQTAQTSVPRASARPSRVRDVLSQAALHLYLPDASDVSRTAGPEYERLRSTLSQLKADVRTGGSGAARLPAQQHLATDSESSRVVEHVNAQSRSMQRAFSTLTDTLEDEVATLRAADAQQWDQLKLHASQFGELGELRSELAKTREELRSVHAQLASFRATEHEQLGRRVEELCAENEELRRLIVPLQKSAAGQHSLVDEIGALKRWQTDVAPAIDAAEGRLARHEARLERDLPALRHAVDDVSDKLAKHVPELTSAADAATARQQELAEEAAQTAAEVRRLADAHAHATARLQGQLTSGQDELRASAEAFEIRCRQLSSEVESHAEALRALSAEGQKARHEAREEADTIAAALRASQASASAAAEAHERDVAALRGEIKEVRAASSELGAPRSELRACVSAPRHTRARSHGRPPVCCPHPR